MASAYVAEIQQMQPEGPYYLGGYCMGGSIAYEAARQLENQGGHVAMVAMFDTQYSWVDMDRRRLRGLFQNAVFHAGNIMQADCLGKLAFLKERSLEALRRIIRRLRVLASRINADSGVLPVMEEINHRAAMQYRPGPYMGRIYLFVPCKGFKGFDAPGLGWENVETGGINVIKLTAYPNGMLVEPYVREMAEKLKECIEEAK